jgi:hypothetical protein
MNIAGTMIKCSANRVLNGRLELKGLPDMPEWIADSAAAPNGALHAAASPPDCSYRAMSAWIMQVVRPGRNAGRVLTRPSCLRDTLEAAESHDHD